MNGIEKITDQIGVDAQQEIDALTAKAQREADEILADYTAQAEAEAVAILARGRRDAAQREERMESVANLEARKERLGTKQEMVSLAFQRALEQLCNLPEEAYITLLADLAFRAARTGRETVVFSQRDRTRIGKQVVTRANELLAKQVAPKLPDELTDSRAGAFLDKVVTGTSAFLAGTGMLSMAEESRPMRGGLILQDDKVETNCTFEVLIRLQRDTLSSEVAKMLFD